jgi:hypothetical protein
MGEEDRMHRSLAAKEIYVDSPHQSGVDSPSFAGNCKFRPLVTVSISSCDVTHQFGYTGGRLEFL